MSATSAEEEAPELQKHPRMAARPQLIRACDFRSAGRLSNESARALTVVYELVARNLAGSLSNYFGTNLIVRLVSLDQVPVGEFVASVAALSFIGTVSVGSVSGSLLLACDIELAFPMIDLLLGGTGVASEPRELSEIEDEIMQDLMLLIARQTGTAWRASETSPPTVVRIAPAALQDVFPTTEKVVLVTFEMALPGITGRLQVMFPSSMGQHAGQAEQAGPAAEEGRAANLSDGEHSRTHFGLRCTDRSRFAEPASLGPRSDRAAAGVGVEAACSSENGRDVDGPEGERYSKRCR